MAGFVKIAKSDEIQPGLGKMVEVDGKKIALPNVAGAFYAIDDTCTHRGGPLSDGELHGKEVTCPWHGAVLDVTTGQVLRPPAPRGVSSYNVRVEGADIEVEI
jgi:nitrite reductase/ring-hydroxylating ferredoxin subunit